MSWETISLAFVAGVVTFFNPCGFALLPAYVAHYLGQRTISGSSPARGSWLESGWRGLSLGLIVSAGFFYGLRRFGLGLLGIGQRRARSDRPLLAVGGSFYWGSAHRLRRADALWLLLVWLIA